MKIKKHFTDNYIVNPTHPITVAVIGCGGTGSQVLSGLAKMNHALVKLGHAGLYVKAYDNDVVSSANIGRQLFCESDIGLNKATVLVSRLNRFFGTAWEDVPEVFNGVHNSAMGDFYNITITCVDNIKSRIEVAKYLSGKTSLGFHPYTRPYYWMDLGNTASSGQVVIGTVGKIKQPKSKKYQTVAKLPFVTELFDFSTIDEKDSGPSCSLAEALNKQDLFINPTLANLGCNLLWKLFRELGLDYSGLFLNLSTMNVNPIKL